MELGENEDLPAPSGRATETSSLLRSLQQRETVPSSHGIVAIDSPGNHSDRTQETNDDEIEEASPAPRIQQEKQRGQTKSRAKTLPTKRHANPAPAAASSPPTRKRAATVDPDTPSNAQTDVRIFRQQP